MYFIAAEISSVGDALNAVFGIVEQWWGTVVSIYDGLALAIQALLDSIPVSTLLFTFMPAVLVAGLTLTLCIYVLKFIIGRMSS